MDSGRSSTEHGYNEGMIREPTNEVTPAHIIPKPKQHPMRSSARIAMRQSRIDNDIVNGAVSSSDDSE